MLSTGKCLKIQLKSKNLSEKRNSFDITTSSSINSLVERRAKALQCKYNLSDEQIDEIVNSLYCISENIIKDNIEKQTKHYIKK